jgi:DNA primase
MISNEDIQQVKNKMDIVDTIQSFIKLKKQGANYTGSCPFHNEKTSSFTVSPSKQIYKCFGCGKSGNTVTFVMEHEKLSFPETIKYLAGKLNIDIKEIHSSAEQKEKATEGDSLLIINSFANNFFKEQLQVNQDATNYVKQRGISNEMVAQFEIGFCGGDYSYLSNEFIKNQYSIDKCVSAGLIKEKNGNIYDSYHNRLMFPIHSIIGKVIGFGGRILIKNDNQPKYINTPENFIYQKNSVLYGLYFAKKSISILDEAILVEGYTDVIGLHQAEITNVVSSSGTSLTENQIRIIRRLTKNITMFYDGDSAGVKAIIRGMEMSIAEGMSVRIVTLPKDEDPDSFVKANGAEYTSKYIKDNKKDVVDFYTQNQDISTPDKKDAALKHLCSIVSKIGDDNFFRKKHYIDKISKEFGVPIDIVKSHFKVEEKKEQQVVQQQEHPEKEYLIWKREKELTRLLVLYADKDYYNGEKVYSEIINTITLSVDDLYHSNTLTKLVIEEFNKCIEQDGLLPDIKYFIQHSNIELSQFAASIGISKYELSDNWNKQNDDTKKYLIEIKNAIGLYQLSFYKMNLYLLTSGKIDTSNWDEREIVGVELELKKMMRDKAKELGLTNFKL